MKFAPTTADERFLKILKSRERGRAERKVNTHLLCDIHERETERERGSERRERELT